MTTIRVTAGTLRGRRITVPPADVRPTSERARQAFFNIVGSRIDGAAFLDLFAGSGIFSFEAVSRGAASATAIDRDRRHVEAIARRAGEWHAPVTAIAGDVVKALSRLRGQAFDVVYADPPYDYRDYGALLAAMEGNLSLKAEAVVAVEHRRHTSPFPSAGGRMRPVRQAEYGEVSITFFEAETTIA